VCSQAPALDASVKSILNLPSAFARKKGKIKVENYETRVILYSESRSDMLTSRYLTYSCYKVHCIMDCDYNFMGEKWDVAFAGNLSVHLWS
jgi:hypothetical protein